jgi:hypothetical protein
MVFIRTGQSIFGLCMAVKAILNDDFFNRVEYQVVDGLGFAGIRVVDDCTAAKVAVLVSQWNLLLCYKK